MCICIKKNIPTPFLWKQVPLHSKSVSFYISHQNHALVKAFLMRCHNLCFKVNLYIFRGSNSVLFMSASFSVGVLWEQILLFKNSSFLEMFCRPRNNTGCHKRFSARLKCRLPIRSLHKRKEICSRSCHILALYVTQLHAFVHS